MGNPKNVVDVDLSKKSKNTQSISDFVTGNIILAGILGVKTAEADTHFSALKLKKKKKKLGSWSYEIRNINSIGCWEDSTNHAFQFVNSSQYKRGNGCVSAMLHA